MALLKLVRKGLAKQHRRPEYKTVRDARRLLSGARDCEVTPKTLAWLVAGSIMVDKVAVRQIDPAFARAERDFEEGWDCPEAIDQAVEELSASRKRCRLRVRARSCSGDTSPC